MNSRILKGIPIVLAVGLLSVEIYAFLTAPHGYVAAYALAGIWIISVGFIALGSVLCIFKKTRAIGLRIAISFILVIPAFYLAMFALYNTGVVAWCKPRKVIVNPNSDHGLVYFLKKDITAEERDFFLDSVAVIQRKDGRGHDLLPGVQSLLGIQSVDGYEGYALRYSSDITENQKSKNYYRIKGSPAVKALFEDVNPTKVRVDTIMKNTP
jgi:hypothetical protein